MTEEYCEHCGARLKKYWHKMTPGLVRTLIVVYKKVAQKQENVVNKNELDLDHSQYGNFQKLRFHGLIAKHKPDGIWKKGEWVMTHRGAEFLKGNIQIPARVQTFRNKVEDHDDQMVTITEVMKSQLYWEKDFEYDIFQPTQKTLL